ncbi:hydroxybutyrate dehydrogenase [Apiospora rasikravindrae]|uniref:Hydroxybutyrate dehydrogenase n=1 Tax=Apiospora rasikravindrae TaxID=990691 RepID=A0ABR1T165_9PEZI
MGDANPDSIQAAEPAPGEVSHVASHDESDPESEWDPNQPFIVSDDKPTVLITGCSDGGIGSALALKFWDRGYHIYATARHVGNMQAMSCLSDVAMLQLDVTKPEDIREAADVVARQTGFRGLDILVNNAAQPHFMPLLDEDLDKVRDTFEVNYMAPLAVTQAFAPLLLKSKGMAVFVTSIAGHVNIPYIGTYSASKCATEMMAETLRHELRPFDVDVMEIVTGGVKSKGQSHFDDYTLPEGSLYKSIEHVIKSRAQGHDGMPRMDTMEYATGVVDEILSRRTKGRFWYGTGADLAKGMMMPAGYDQDAMDAIAVKGQGLDELGKKMTLEARGR